MRSVGQQTIFCLIVVFLMGCSDSRRIYNGYIEGRLTYISSQTTGVLQNLFVKKGEQIYKNKTLFQLEPDPDLADFNRSTSQLKKARANLLNLVQSQRPTEIATLKAQRQQIQVQRELALKTERRIEHLNQKGYATPQQLDQATANVKDLNAKIIEISKRIKTARLTLGREGQLIAAKSDVSAAEAALDKVAWKLSQVKINSPITGRVFDIFYRVGEVVSSGHPVLALLAPENIYAVFFVPERQFSEIKIGQRVSLKCDGCKQPFAATINYISPVAEYTPQVFYTENSRSKLVFRVEAGFLKDSEMSLSPGQPVDVMLYKGPLHQ
jgi:HlyD family secretion protein